VLAGPLAATATAIVQIGNDASTLALHPQERALEQGLPTGRRADFIAGRMAAARALQALNVKGPVLRDGRRPLFPTAVHGSISHCTGHIGACLASTHPQVLAMGVDIERTDRLGHDAARLVCTPLENAWIQEARRPESRLSVVFSAKEAVYKALSALDRDEVVFHDVELQVHGGRLHAHLRRNLLPPECSLVGWVRLLADRHVLSSVAIVEGYANPGGLLVAPSDVH
jgi:4'-phosphopantetheinyl transferase EntD